MWCPYKSMMNKYKIKIGLVQSQGNNNAWQQKLSLVWTWIFNHRGITNCMQSIGRLKTEAEIIDQGPL